MNLPDTRVAIIGLGLLGGSFGLAVRQARAVREVAGVDLTQALIDRAVERGAIDWGEVDPVAAVRQADLVVLAMPVRTIIHDLAAMTRDLSEQAILFDLGSTKAEISRTVAALPRMVRYVGGHPMAGSERSGIDAADARLFAGVTFALVPTVPPDEEALRLLSQLVRQIGATPVILPPDRHDRIVAVTSHLPYLVSSALVRTADAAAHQDHRLWEFAAGGFRDTSRVAASNVRVMVDICLTNREPILDVIQRMQSELDQTARWLQDGDEQSLESALLRAKTVRTAVFGERGRTVSTKTVSFQGERGANSEIAALEFFGDEAEIVPQPSFEAVFDAVERGHSEYGILPIENSLAGSIHRNYDLMLQHSLSIVGELKLRIVHNLLVNKGVKLEDIRQVHSHPQALDQCREFFRVHPEMEPVSVYDTAGAAKLLKERGDSDVAAIASTQAAVHYDLDILARSIEDNPQNFTRFLVLAQQPVQPKGERAKTSIVFSVANKPGSLFKAMSVFALRDIDICKIESRPLIGTPWDYLFYLDFRGSADSLPSSRALTHLQEIATYFKLLGSYEEGRTVDGGGKITPGVRDSGYGVREKQQMNGFPLSRE